ncbi:MAG: DUF1570 domain-containing protein [Novosphingobium sp.]
MPFRQHTLVAASALALTALAAPAHAEWLEAKSTHFTLVGDVSEQQIKRRVDRLERFDAMMRIILPGATQSNVPVLLVDTPETARKLLGQPDSNILAYFRPSPFGDFAVSPVQTSSDLGIGAETVLFHEYVHHILLSSLDEPMPRWMSEGMAELFMTSRLEDDGGITIGIGNEARGYSLNRLGRWDVRRMLESDTRPPTRQEVDQIYAKGWVTLHYLLFSGKRQGQFGKFLDALRKGVPQMQAGEQAFGDLGKFESELEYYRLRKSLPAVRVTPAQLKAALGVTLRRLAPGEAAIMPARMQSMVGVGPKTAGPLADASRAIGARFPDDAFVQRAIAEMEFDAKNFDLADQAIDRALAARPDYVDALCYKGFLIGNRARRESKPELWRAARTAILKANRLAPDMALPFVLYYDTFAASGQVPNTSAVDGLLRAIVVQPTYGDLRTKVALRLIETGDFARARSLLAGLAFAPHQSPDNAYAKLIGEIDKGTRGEALKAKIAEFKVAPFNLFDTSRIPAGGEAPDPKPPTAPKKDG